MYKSYLNHNSDDIDNNEKSEWEVWVLSELATK